MTKEELVLKALFEKAHATGMAAVAKTVPVPMTVTAHANPLDDKSPAVQSWYVEDGACGFAWVTIFPGTSKEARFAKKYWNASAAYGGGTQIWVSAFNQSVAKKEAYAEAFAEVLRSAGIKAYAGSRLD